MNRIEKTLVDASSRLGRAGVGFALVGGLAVSARSEPRFTRDVDLAVAVPGDPAAEEVVRSFVNAGFSAIAVVEQEATGRMATVRLLPPGETEEGVVVDLLFASSGVETEVVHSADRIAVFPDTELPVATLAHLVALKVLAADETRPQDDVDLQGLLHEATDADIRETRRILGLITERGFARNRDLRSRFDEALARWRPSTRSD
jgi:predicted nucleotidyltransferase